MTAASPSPVAIRAAGDSALLLELEPAIDAGVNARAIAIADTMRAASVPGVTDVVSTYRSVAVYFHPADADVEALGKLLLDACGVAPRPADGRLVTLPVTYGGEGGPDLEGVAAWAGLTPTEVIRRHTAATYRVFMLGFLPGFAYMGPVDPVIAAPRLPTPRLRVPAGSVGIAGGQTGVYPMTSPGGWRIIGCTPEPMFDPAWIPAARLVPGDSVRFVETGTGTYVRERPVSSPRAREAPASRVMTVLEPGLFTTVQDLGRWGHQAMGVPVSGAMDWFSHRLANLLAGNGTDAATLEATLTGPTLRFDAAVTVAIAGADLSASLDGHDMRPGSVRLAMPGSVLRFDGRRSGARTYIACDGGIAIRAVLGSRSTHTTSGIGGFEGRALRAGDQIPLGSALTRPQDLPHGTARDQRLHSTGAHGGSARVRVLPGPQAYRFSGDALAALQTARFVISPQSNRMGYRLSGATVPAPAGEMISDATFTGAIQVPPSGEPIVLMADRQTTGGYAQLATIISADLPLAAQLAPGDTIEFTVCDGREALAALRDREGMLARLG